MRDIQIAQISIDYITISYTSAVLDVKKIEGASSNESIIVAAVNKYGFENIFKTFEDILTIVGLVFLMHFFWL